MSSSLCWRPIVEGKSLPDELKWVLEKKYDLWHEREFSVADLTYLEGLQDGGLKAAKELIDLIEKYGHVMVKLEC